MPSRRIRVRGGARDQVRAQIARIQTDLKVSPEFPGEVTQAAEAAALQPRLPDLDLTDLEFVTIDPATSMDLDQAMLLERAEQGFRVHYAIADVAAFVTPGDVIDQECHRRGETLYGADSKIPLHPRALSEAAASLLPDQERPAIVWTLDLDQQGALRQTDVRRARVRSRAKLSYVEVQDSLDRGEPRFELLREIGSLRQRAEIERGGVSLPLPEQEIEIEGEHWELAFRQPLPVELWNAQISLLTGMAAAQLMLAGNIGILRTLPPADQRATDRLRRTAKALHVAWPGSMTYPEFVRSLNPDDPKHAAMIVACTTLLRGAGYTCFNGEPPNQIDHAAIAAPYAHVTAPLRRLVDRYGLEICVALAAGTAVPEWVTAAFDSLPVTMQSSGRLARRYENAVLDLVEAQLLSNHVGESFSGVILEVDPEDAHVGQIQIADPAVEAVVEGPEPLPLGEEVTVRLTLVDPQARQVRFRVDAV